MTNRRLARATRRLLVLALVLGPLVGGALSWPESLSIYSGTTGNAGNFLRVSDCLACSQLLVNPGFETGTIAPWTATWVGTVNSLPAWPPYSGTSNAVLDLNISNGKTQDLTQAITIPSGLATATLTFWLRIATVGTVNTSTLSVRVLDGTTNAVLTTLLPTIPHANTGIYIQRSYNVAAYIGQSIKVNFHGVTMGSRTTTFMIDDTAFNVS